MSNSPFNYQMILAYDGTPFGGWQIQPNAITIQQILQETLSTILRHPTHVTGAGRTDAGVHALGQSAHFQSPEHLNLFKILRSLNGMLPPEIRVLQINPVPDDFHARYAAKGKIYRYHLNLGPFNDPFTRNFAWYVPGRLNFEALQQAAAYFVGKHDFRSFANVASHDHEERDTVRTIFRLDVIYTERGLFFEFEGDGFLYKMVRNIVGCLVEVAIGKYLPTQIPKMLEAHDRRAGGRAAPPQGLFLVKVNY